LAPFALHRHTTPYRHNCERNIRASKWHENEGFVPEQRAVTTLERIEEIAVPVIQQVLYCKLRKCDRDQCYAQGPAQATGPAFPKAGCAGQEPKKRASTVTFWFASLQHA
jgi:hypothetical protein